MIKSANRANSRLESLKQQIASLGTNRIDYLVVAHTDVRMIERIKNALFEKTIALVAVPQNSWAMDNDSLVEMFAWAVSDLGVEGILLVGHSQGGTPDDCIQVCSRQGVDSAEIHSNPRTGTIFDRVQQAQSSVQQNENHFIRELESLRCIPAIENREVRKNGLVQGLFYRAESGVFCVYEPETETFRPLIGNNGLG